MTNTTTGLLEQPVEPAELTEPVPKRRLHGSASSTKPIPRQTLRGSLFPLLLGLGVAALALSIGAAAGTQRPLLVSLAIILLALAPRAAVGQSTTTNNR